MAVEMEAGWWRRWTRNGGGDGGGIVVEMEGVGDEERFSGEGGLLSSKSSTVHHPLKTDHDPARARDPRS